MYFDIKPGDEYIIDTDERAQLYVIHARYKFINIETYKLNTNSYGFRIKTSGGILPVVP